MPRKNRIHEKPKNFKGTVKNLISYMRPYYLRIFFVLCLTIGATIISIVGPKILGNATTLLFDGIVAKIGGTGSIDFAGIFRILATLAFLYLLLYLNPNVISISDFCPKVPNLYFFTVFF